jgi:hypothetical protein
MIFSGPMVKAILAGRKTMTRRVVKPQPPAGWDRHCWYDAPRYGFTAEPEPAGAWHVVRCPYGVPGDLLWCRETWCPVDDRDHDGSLWVDYRATPRYSAEKPAGWENAPSDTEALNWRSPITMPRWASRLTLRVESVRVERLQAISEEDAIAEGIESTPCMARPGKRLWCDYNIRHDPFEWYADPRDSFRSLWDTINSKRGFPWESNPWVWVVAFSKVEG